MTTRETVGTTTRLRSGVIALAIVGAAIVGSTPQQASAMGSGPRKPAVPKVVGKSYAEARRALTNAGWQPTRSDRGSDASGNAELFRSMGFTEMVSCSGTGFAPCRFRFVDRSGRILAVVTQGEEGYDGHATVTRVTITNR